MFERILFKPGGLGRNEVDFGEIAEAMVFYGQVHLALNEGTLRALLSQIGIDDLLVLASSGNLEISVFRNALATHEAKKQVGTFYDFVTVEPLRSNRSERDPREIIQDAFVAASGKPGKSRRAAQRFLQQCKVESINEGVPHENGMPALSREDLQDADYVTDAIKAALSVLAPVYQLPVNLKLELEHSQEGFRLYTNLDIRAINKAHKESFPSSVTDINFALLLDSIHSARGDIFLAARHYAELVTSSLSSAVVSKRLQRTVSRMIPAEQFEQVPLFQAEYIAGRSIREVINSKERSVRDLVALVEGAEKFHDWLKETPADSRLIREYTQALVIDTWIDKLPAKSIRYIIFTAAGLAVEAFAPTGAAFLLSQGLGLGDTFLLDKLFRGWKPNQFVENELTKFLLPKKEE